MLRHAAVPSLKPHAHFNAHDDAQALKDAMAGKGCDEKAVMNILCRRSNAQRQEIKAAYKSLYGEDLVKDLTKELKGSSEDLTLALLQPTDEFEAAQLYKAMKGLGTDEAVLIEIMASRNNREIQAIKSAYHRLYDKELERALVDDTSGDFAKLLVTICAANRNESKEVDESSAAFVAQEIHDAVTKKSKNDAGQLVFDRINSNMSYAQLSRIFKDYQKLSGHDIDDVIEKEFSGDHRESILAVARVAKCRAAFLAGCLNKSVKGKDDKGLIRMAVSRCEKDMKTINQEYQRQYATSVLGDTNSAFKEALSILITGQ